MINVTYSDKEITVKANILEYSDRKIKVAIGFDDNLISLILTKKAPGDKVFVGNKFGLKFTTDGKEI